MLTRAPCPDAHVLQRLALGLLPREQAETLEQHVSTCTRCGDALRSLPGEDPLVDAVRHARRPVLDASDRPVVEGLVPWLKKKGGGGASVTLPPETVSLGSATPAPYPGGAGTQTLYDFLAPPQQSDELGRLGPYRVLRVLGSGGMGVVFLAEDPRLDRRVALKVIRPEQVARAGAKERFLREARATAKVEHDHIVTVYHADEAGGVPYLAMPLLRGESLDDRLQRAQGKPLPLEEVLHIGREIAEGLAAAHAVGLIHRDIKPGNIWLEGTTKRPRVKVLDFGLARALSGEASDASQHGTIVGTPAYMAPEQARPGPIDARADLFSLGCVLYQMSTGRRPFHGADLIATLMAVASDTPTPVRGLNPTVPQKVARLIERLLEKQPDNRPATAAEVAASLRAAEHELAVGPTRWLLRALLAAAAAVAAAALAVYLMLPPAGPEDTKQTDNPAVVTFTCAEADLPLTVQRGDAAAVPIDLKNGGTHELPAGDYAVLADRPGMKVLPERFSVSAGETREVRVQLVGEVVGARYGKLGPVWSMAMHPQAGLLCLIGGEGEIAVRNADVPKELGRMSLPGTDDTEIRALALSPDGTRAVSGGGSKEPEADLSIRLWNVTTCKQIAVVGRHTRFVTGLAFAPDGKRIVSCSHDGTAQVWDLNPPKSRASLRHPGDGSQKVQVHAVAFSPDGNRIATGASDKLVRLWNANGGPALVLLGHTEAVRGVAFLPDGRGLVSASDDGTLIVWDLLKNATRATLRGHKGAVTHVAVSRDGRRILSGGKDGTVRLWDVASAALVVDLTATHKDAGHKEVRGVAFSADGRYALSAGAEKIGNVRLWRLPE